MGTPRFVLYNDIRIRTVNELGRLGGATDATTATKTKVSRAARLGRGKRASCCILCGHFHPQPFWTRTRVT
jgi:hypothetical protein